MLRLIFSRLALAVPVLVCVSIVAFILLRLAPGDPAQLQAGLEASPDVVAAVRHELALDQPLAVQYLTWAGRVVHGDLGVSYSTPQPLPLLIGQRFPVTCQISITAFILIGALGGPPGLLSRF